MKLQNKIKHKHFTACVFINCNKKLFIISLINALKIAACGLKRYLLNLFRKVLIRFLQCHFKPVRSCGRVEKKTHNYTNETYVLAGKYHLETYIPKLSNFHDTSASHEANLTCIFLYSVEEKMPRFCSHKQPII